ADEIDTLLILALNLRGSDGIVDAHQVSCGHHDALRGADQNVIDVVDVLALVLPQADDNRVFLPGLAEESRLRPGDIRANRISHRGGAHAEQRSLGPIDAEGELRPSVIPAEA